MRARLIKIQHFNKGYERVLKSPGVEAEVHAQAVKASQQQERETGKKSEVLKLERATSRPVYVARTEREYPTGYLTHEKWVNVVWPMVGGPKWRPNRNQKGYQGKKG